MTSALATSAPAVPASANSVRLPAAIPARRICLAPGRVNPLRMVLPDPGNILTERSVSRNENLAKTPAYRRGAPDGHPRCSAGQLLEERLPRRLDRRHRT